MNRLIKQPLKALFFIQNGLGGAERITIEIVKMLISSNWNISMAIICNNYDSDTSRIESYIPKDVNILKVVNSGQLKFLYNLYTTIKKSDANVVFASAMHINQRLLLLSPFFRSTKFIVRNDNYLYTLPKLKQFTLSITYRLADAIIAQTEEMESELQKIGLQSSKIKMLHNPVNKSVIIEKATEANPYPQDSDKVFVAVGRIAHQKGFDVLIDAFYLVKKQIKNCKLYIVGDIYYNNSIIYNQLVKQIAKLDLSDSVVFTGFQSNPYKYIANADVFVLSSRYEGLPNTLIEAQVLGKPCAAVKCIPIIERIISDNINGFLSDVDNHESLAYAMIKALNMKSIKMIYSSATPADFVNLFENIATLN